MTRPVRIALTLAELLILLTLVAVMVIIIVERCEKQIDGNDILWEEVRK